MGNFSTGLQKFKTGFISGVKSLKNKEWFLSFSSSLMCVLMGLIIGLIIMLVIRSNRAFDGLGRLIISGFKTGDNIARFLYGAAPIMMTGLSVAVAFKTGMFNIGTPGQFLWGMCFSLTSAILWKWPWWASIIFSILGGAICGAIPGILKAYFNVNEVLSAIMLNWISVIISCLYLFNVPGLMDPVQSDKTLINIASVNPGAIIPYWGLNAIGRGLTISFIIAIIFAILMWFVMSKTNFGFELRATGSNKFAARYTGISDKRSIILTFVIAGALSGIGGALKHLSPVDVVSGYQVVTTTLPSEGFTGISVALLGANNPIGCIFSAFFVSYLTVSGESLQSLGYAPEVIEVITGVIIYFSSFVMAIRIFIKYLYGEFNFVHFCRDSWKWLKSLPQKLKNLFTKKKVAVSDDIVMQIADQNANVEEVKTESVEENNFNKEDPLTCQNPYRPELDGYDPSSVRNHPEMKIKREEEKEEEK